MKKIPQRKCVGCHQMFDKSVLLRVFKDKSGQGRSAYICNSASCIEQARKTKGIERSLKQAISIDLYENLFKNMLGG
ncbi:MAG: YlxR family protein [Defluviitaleaceae bacterium]|nr:YlxR family protein [Defluviitaleaceae bacterium]